MKKMKKLLAFILAVVMAVSVLPITEQTAEAAGTDTINLRGPVWSNNYETYQFSDVTVDFSGNGQKIFCLSVDNEGTFVLPQTVNLGGKDTEIKGVQKVGGKLEYVGSVTGGMELSSLTVIGTSITQAQVEDFIKALVFHRNGVPQKAKQKVSVVSNKVDLSGKDMTVMAVDGVIHYYKYVLYPESDTKSTWYTAYNIAKSAKFQEMKGYLATVTSENEQLYLYGDLNEDEENRRNSINLRAWIGGARALNAGNYFDADSVTDGAFDPGVKWEASIANTWYWMCGPEAGTPFYKTGEGGTKWGGEAVEGAYNGWNDNNNEPNNQYGNYTVKDDPYQQEYVLEYGYEAANWNDYSPYNVTRNSQWGIEGYIIEFSPYRITNQDGTTKENIAEKEPSATDMKIIVVDDGIVMTANDFILSTEEAEKLTADEAKEAGKVTVTDKSVTVTDPTAIQVNEGQLKTINEGEKGEYDLKYTYENGESGESASEKVTVTVVDETKEGKANDGFNADIKIGANNFSITLEQAKAIKDDLSKQTDLIKTLANAVATENGNTVDPKNITIKGCTIEPKRGENYTVTFEYKGVPVTVKVKVLDNGSEKTTVNLTANDFTVTAGQSNELTPDSFITESNATAVASDGSNVTVVPDDGDLKKLNDAIKNGSLGEYKVKVTGTAEDGTSASTVVTVKVVAYPYIDAHDFIISVDKAKEAEDGDIITASDAGRLEQDGGNKVSNSITVPNKDKLNNVQEPGTVSGITLHDPQSSAGDREVSATVVDKTQKGFADNGSDQNAYVVVGANNFNLTMKQAQQIVNDPTSDTVLDIIKTLANAVATNNGKAVDRNYITVNPANIQAENGVYPVTFTYWGQTVTVNATVKDEGSADNNTPVGKIPDINLTANDFSIPAKSPALNTDTTPADAFKKMADVVAKLNDGSSVTDVTPDNKQLTELVNAVNEGKKGEYPVTVTAKDKDGTTVTTTVTVTVTDEGGDSTGADITNPKHGDEHIGANNFVIGTDDFSLLTPENVLKLSNAEAYDIDTKADVPVTKVDTSKVENKPGKYPITLSTDKETSTTVYVTIDENWKTIGDVDKASDANKKDTSVDQDKAVPADKTANKPSDTKGDDKTFELSNPKDVTQNLDSGREVDNVSLAGTTLPAGDYTVSGSTLTIKSSALAGKPEGTYPVVVNYKDGSKRTFNVVVVDKAVVDESNMSGDELNNRDDLPLLLAKGIGGDKKIKLTWLKYKGAEGYDVYWSYCNGKKVYKKVTSTKAKVRTATHKKLSYKKSYKYFVIAYKMVDGKKVYIAKSPQIHVAMKKDKKTNAKKVTVKKSKVTLKPGKTSVIKASMTREDPKKKLLQHAVKFRYYTDDYRVAKVNSKGKIKAVAAGKCNIYVIANNGVYKKIKVTVKK